VTSDANDQRRTTESAVASAQRQRRAGAGGRRILTRDKRGVWAYYGLVPAAMNALAAVLSTTCYTVSGM
jgi:hypothetical protein